QFLQQYHQQLEYAFMIDAKEFIDAAGHVDKTTLLQVIPPQSDSIFRWCRIATHDQNIREAVKLAELIRQLGYKIGINLMGISLLDHQQLSTAAKLIASSEADVFYFADSFGSFTPK